MNNDICLPHLEISDRHTTSEICSACKTRFSAPLDINRENEHIHVIGKGEARQKM
jgi:hypothetical protein